MIKKCDASTHIRVFSLQLAVWGFTPSIYIDLFSIYRIYLYDFIGSFFIKKNIIDNMKIRTHNKKQRITKYMQSLKIDNIKNQNLGFAVCYAEPGKTETYTDFLEWSEIQKPDPEKIEIKKIFVFKNGILKKPMQKYKSEKLLLLLDFHNKKIIA